MLRRKTPLKRTPMRRVAKRNPMPEGRWAQAMYRDRGECQVHAWGFPTTSQCSGALIVHHRKPKGIGGTPDPRIHDLDNLTVLCGGATGRAGHHGEVHDRPADAYACGLLVRAEGAGSH